MGRGGTVHTISTSRRRQTLHLSHPPHPPPAPTTAKPRSAHAEGQRGQRGARGWMLEARAGTDQQSCTMATNSGGVERRRRSSIPVRLSAPLPPSVGRQRVRPPSGMPLHWCRTAALPTAGYCSLAGSLAGWLAAAIWMTDGLRSRFVALRNGASQRWVAQSSSFSTAATTERAPAGGRTLAPPYSTPPPSLAAERKRGPYILMRGP